MHLPSLALAFALAATPALARGSVEQCTGLAELAHAIMEVRQTGAPVYDFIAHMRDGETPEQADALTGLIELAYGEPLYSSPDYKAEAAAEFANVIYGACREQGA